MKSSSFGVGEFATVTCAIAKGASVAASDFGVASFKAVDANGAAIGGLGATLTVEMK